MSTGSGVKTGIALVLLALFLTGLSTSCTTTVPPRTPPENYKGPIADQPVLQQEDYWVYQRANLEKVGSKTLFRNMEFPLWVGKTWMYETEAIRAGQPQTTKAPRVRTRVHCHTGAFKQVTVAAGTFGAFECECVCEVITLGRLEPHCGSWTLWYAPDVKNVIRTKTESTNTSFELLEYRVSRPTPRRP